MLRFQLLGQAITMLGQTIIVSWLNCCCPPPPAAAVPCCCVCSGADQWASLCDALASRLAQTGMQHAASLCYICAGNVDQVGGLQGLLGQEPVVAAEGQRSADAPTDALRRSWQRHERQQWICCL
jgi:hypothetical protein